MNQITKAVFPVAGLGTRFLPATKAVPKELLPIIDTPALQLVLDEAIGAGVHCEYRLALRLGGGRLRQGSSQYLRCTADDGQRGA